MSRRVLPAWLWAVSLATGLVVVGLRHLPHDPPLGAFENTLIDLRFQIRGPRPAPESVLIVAIDDASLESIGLMTPMREALAAAIQRLEAAGAASIVIDLLLVEPTPADDQLAEVLSASPSTILAVAAVPGAAGPVPPEIRTALQKQRLSHRRRLRDETVGPVASRVAHEPACHCGGQARPCEHRPVAGPGCPAGASCGRDCRGSAAFGGAARRLSFARRCAGRLEVRARKERAIRRFDRRDRRCRAGAAQSLWRSPHDRNGQPQRPSRRADRAATHQRPGGLHRRQRGDPGRHLCDAVCARRCGSGSSRHACGQPDRRRTHANRPNRLGRDDPSYAGVRRC